MAGSAGSPPPVFTIGHSTRPLEAFVALLRKGGVSMVIDVRKMPRSRTNPQYNADVLPGHLEACQIGHRYIPQLGGFRGQAPQVAPDVNALWRNRSFHNYADYALTPPFREGLEALLQLAETRRCAIMCAEAVWWRCHRRIIADYLLMEGYPVMHIMGADKVEPARVTEAAVRTGKRMLRYEG